MQAIDSDIVCAKLPILCPAPVFTAHSEEQNKSHIAGEFSGMKRSLFSSGPWVRPLLALGLALFTLIIGVLIVFPRQSVTVTHAQDDGGITFMPVQMAPAPTPTPGPPPQFVKNIPMPKAQCPNAADFNRVSGLTYVANIYSDNVSVFQDQEYLLDLYTGEWPRGMASDPDSARTWVTNLHDGTTLLDGAVQIGLVPRDYEPYAPAYNPVNGYLYVGDLNGNIQVIDGSQLVTTIQVVDPITGNKGGWILSVVVDSRTGLVYASSWQFGRLYVIDGTEVIDSVLTGTGAQDMAFDEVRGLIYIAHRSPSFEYPHDISVVDLATRSVTFVDPFPMQTDRAQEVALDVANGLAYFTNPDIDSVTVVQGTNLVARIPVGNEPWGIAVNPNDGYVFAANRKSNDVSILRNGALLDTVEVQGRDPVAVSVDTINNDIYIANRGEAVGSAECEKASVTILH